MVEMRLVTKFGRLVWRQSRFYVTRIHPFLQIFKQKQIRSDRDDGPGYLMEMVSLGINTTPLFRSTLQVISTGRRWVGCNVHLILVAAVFVLCLGRHHVQAFSRFSAFPSSSWPQRCKDNNHNCFRPASPHPKIECTSLRTTTKIFAKAVKLSYDPWFPLPNTAIDAEEYEQERSQIEEKAIQLAARLLNQKLREKQQPSLLVMEDEIESRINSSTNDNHHPVDGLSMNEQQPQQQSERVAALVENRFLDLSCSEKGEHALENLIYSSFVEDEVNDNVIRGTIMVIQSLCVFAMQVGVKGTPDQLRRMVAHLDPRRNPSLIERDLMIQWDGDSVRRLKYQMDRSAAVQLLSQLRWKRTAQGAFDLLVTLGVWEPHEDVSLLRSGFPLRFSKNELDAATTIMEQQQEQQQRNGHSVDPEQILGIRKDLRHLKVYTIDGASTLEIDDGLSVEEITHAASSTTSSKSTTQDSQETRHRIWIHIADADHYAPPGSVLFETARKRITSIYIPGRTFSMFPPIAGSQLMSLNANSDSYALSLGVEVKSDGSVSGSDIILVLFICRLYWFYISSKPFP